MTVVDTAGAELGLLERPILPTPGQIKAQLADGTLPAALSRILPAAVLPGSVLPGSVLPGSVLPGDAVAGAITGVRLVQEKHRRDSTGLILRVELGPAGAAGPVELELVLHYPRSGAAAPAVAPRAWWYPADPYLPGIADLDHPRSFLRSAGWQSADGRGWVAPAGEYSVRQLGYKPGQRASFVLETTGPGPSMMLKTVRPNAFDDLLARAWAIDSSPLTRRIRLPRLIASSAEQGAFLYEYLPGRGLDTLPADQLSALAAVLLNDFVRLTGMIHGTTLPGFPAWSAAAELDKSRLLVEHAALNCPAAAPELRAILTRLGRLFAAARPSGRLIHNDLTARNLLYDDQSRQAATTPQLTVIDWDSAVIGPVERDLAAFLSSRVLPDDQTGSLIETYRRNNGALDVDLINGFLAHQRLLKACRRYLAAGVTDRFIGALGLVTDRLDRNPLGR